MQLRPRRGEGGQMLVGIVVAMVVLALMALIALHGFGSSPPDKALGTKTAGAGTATGVIKRASVEALAASANTILEQAVTLALPTGLGPGAVDPTSPGSTYLEVAAREGGDTATTLHGVGGDHYELSLRGAHVCITAPVTAAGTGSVVDGTC